MMKNIVRHLYAASAAVLLLAAGCGKEANAVRKPEGTMSITSNPSGATITILRKNIGVTPRKTNPVPPQMYIVKIEKDGYEPCWVPVTVEDGRDVPVEVRLRPVTAAAMLTSEPSGAKVLKDGKEVGVTPCVLTNLGVGPHSVLLELQGYSPQQINWEISSSRPFAEHTILRSNTGMLRVDSLPTDASLYIDGVPSGRTPVTVKVAHGERSVRVEKRGYETFNTAVMVKREETASTFARLKMQPIPISIQTDPSPARISVNGQYCGDSPCVFRAEQTGTYSIRAEKDNFSGATQEITVAPGNKYDVSLKLESELGALEFLTIPGGVEVFVDGKPYGKTQADPKHGQFSKLFRIESLPQGKHTLKLTHPRALKNDRVKTFQFTIRKGKTTRKETVEFWVPNAILQLKNGFRQEGRILDFESDPITFEPKPKVRSEYPRAEIKEIHRIREEE